MASQDDIRYLPRDHANTLDLPAHDFWLFDERQPALLWFTTDDRLLGAQILGVHRDLVGRGDGQIAGHQLHADPLAASN